MNLTFLFEEEKLARDVYLHFSDIYGAVIFSNIAASEQRHMDAVEGLLIKYKQAVPEPGDSLCVYNNTDLETACWTLIAQGETLVGALQSGVDIEVMDIEDIELMMGETIKPDVIQVLGNLLDGSSNHLEAFTQSLNLLEL